MSDEHELTATRPPLDQLEQALIDEFVRMQGHDPRQLDGLPEEARNTLLKEASLYASSRLTEMESRSHLLRGIHDGIPGLYHTGLD